MKTTLIIVSSFLIFQSFAQNLAPNPSFEDYSDCPTIFGWIPGVGVVDHWDYYDSSPDYFNTCATDAGVPTNQFGYQQAASGDGYIGLVTYLSQNGNPSTLARETVGAELISPLVQGTRYYVTFKANLTLKTAGGVYNTNATDKLGVRFTSNPDWVSADDISQVYSNTIITDTLGWELVQGSFVADSAYTHVMIGNFFSNANTNTIELLSSTSEYRTAYYYVDDICVSSDSMTCYGESGVGISELIQPQKKCVRIIDTMGRETEDKPNTLLIFIYNDGTSEKVFRVE